MAQGAQLLFLREEWRHRDCDEMTRPFFFYMTNEIARQRSSVSIEARDSRSTFESFLMVLFYFIIFHAGFIKATFDAFVFLCT
jgi:hypothetical protein